MCCDEYIDEKSSRPAPRNPRPAPGNSQPVPKSEPLWHPTKFWRAVLGMAQILFAIVLIVLEATGLGLIIGGCDRITKVGTGISSSVVFMVAGIAGVSATRMPNVLVSRNRLSVVILFNMIAILFALDLFGVSVNECLNSPCNLILQRLTENPDPRWWQKDWPWGGGDWDWSPDSVHSVQSDFDRLIIQSVSQLAAKMRRDFYILRIFSAAAYFAELILGGCLVYIVSVFYREVTGNHPVGQGILSNAHPAPIYTAQITFVASAQTVGYRADPPIYRYLRATVNPVYPPAQQMPLPERPNAPDNIIYRY